MQNMAEQHAAADSAEWLPEQLPPGVPYSVPTEIKDDPGDLFAYICAACGGNDFNDLISHFKVSRQTFWIWRKHGKGVPLSYREDAVKAFTPTGPKSEQVFRLPTNATVDDIIRRSRGQQNAPRPRDPVQNPHLIDLLHRICNTPELGHAALKTLVGQMSRPVSNPHSFYRWAWVIGGVPRSYVGPFFTALMQLRIYELYGYSEGNRVQWESWAEGHLLAPDNAEDDDEDI